MQEYIIRELQVPDYTSIAAVYNSNPGFLMHHLGKDCIDEAFVVQENADMRKAGFCSCVIVEKESALVQGILDYRPGKEAYLSLLMLAGKLHRKGIGRRIYSDFESEMQQNGSTSIRIDVVDDYSGNLISFWMRLGFMEGEHITLEWGKKKSRAVVMRKYI